MEGKRVYEKLDWAQVQQVAWETAKKIIESRYEPDIMVGISRGGLVPAKLLSDFLQVKDILAIKADHWGITATKDGKARLAYGLETDLSGKKVLLVDDITDTGESMKLSKKHLEKKNPKTIKTATLYHMKGSKFEPDFYSSVKDATWVIFPWNYREDMVNLITSVTKDRGMNIKKIKQELYDRYSLNISIKELKQLLDSVDYLKK